MSTYAKLLLSGHGKIFSFTKNLPLEDTQFGYTRFNFRCVKEMLFKTKYDNILSPEILKKKIPELSCVCDRCKNYYLNPRNNSIKKFDIVFGQLLEDVIIDFFNNEYRFITEHGDVLNKKYPDCVLKDDNSNILAYFEVKYHGAPFINAYKNIGRYCYEGSATMDADKLAKQVKIIEEEIDVPVYYLHWIDYPCIKGIFFETSQQVKSEMLKQGIAFDRKDRAGDFAKDGYKNGYTRKFYADVLNMGSFDQLIQTFRTLTNVQYDKIA